MIKTPPSPGNAQRPKAQNGAGSSGGEGKSADSEATSGLGLGTFLGVFTPTVLTILGVILYLRLGWVLGNAGVVGTFAIVILANVISLITAFSLSALATNMRVGVGGAYFIISRSLGLEVGGALGIPLYLSQTLSVTLYAFGLAESVRIIWPGAPVQLLAAVIVVGVVLIASRSTVFALKMQLPIMLLIGLSLMSLIIGVEWGPSRVDPIGGWENAGFWEVFAVFFPAVTGILAGVGLSGDLADPRRSIPRGVLLAVGVGVVVYLTIPLFLARAADPATLRDDALIWTKVAWVGALVVPGLWGAILSSSLGSILAAPRTLQALAQDRLVPRALGKLDSDSGEPTLALRVSGVVALLAVMLGDLNAVATVVTIFFLTTYGMLNLAAGLEEIVKDPSYRPQIRIPAVIAFLGAFGCFVAMFAISPVAFVVAVSFEALLWWGLHRRSMEAAFGDVRTGFWFALIRFALLKLRRSRQSPRNWRPHILVFTVDLERNVGMVEMASHFSQDHGIVTVTTLLVGDIEQYEATDALVQRNNAMLAARGVKAFTEVVAVPDLDSGIITIAQANGFGGLDYNMVMFGWPGEDANRVASLLGKIRRLSRLEKSSMVMRPVAGSRRRGNGELVIWWKGKEHNGDLMLLMAHLLSVSKSWSGSTIALKSVVEDAEQAQAVRADFEDLLPRIRISAKVDVIVRPPDKTHVDVIRLHSAKADLIFLGLALVPSGSEEDYAKGLIALLEGLPSAILLRNAGPFRGRLV